MKLFLLVCFATTVTVIAGEYLEEDDVLVLTNDNFDEALSEFPNILVEFCKWNLSTVVWDVNLDICHTIWTGVSDNFNRQVLYRWCIVVYLKFVQPVCANCADISHACLLLILRPYGYVMPLL